MFIPDHPLLLPMPKFVQCPKCLKTWFWRTWYLGADKTTCSKCKSNVSPIPIKELGAKVRLIKCPRCGGLQWYTGGKSRTTCTANGCGKKNIIVHVITPDELANIIESDESLSSTKDNELHLHLAYYMERIAEYLNATR